VEQSRAQQIRAAEQIGEDGSGEGRRGARRRGQDQSEEKRIIADRG
jgi:hypothetical protein